MKGFAGILIFLFVLALIGVRLVSAISITVTPGSIAMTVDESDLQGGAGSDLIDTYQSASDLIRIKISQTSGLRWIVYVRKLDINWHNDLHVFLRRTTDGSGPGTIRDGTSYMELTDVDQQFFRGQRNRNNVRAQAQLTGVSVDIPPDTYSTTIYYTVVDL